MSPEWVPGVAAQRRREVDGGKGQVGKRSKAGQKVAKVGRSKKKLKAARAELPAEHAGGKQEVLASEDEL